MSLYVVNRVKKTTIRNYIESYNRCIEYIGDIKLSDIQITHIQNMVNELTAKGYKKRQYNLLFHLYRTALKEL